MAKFKIWESPERMAAHKTVMQKRWEDPAFREKMAEAQRKRWVKHEEKTNNV